MTTPSGVRPLQSRPTADTEPLIASIRESDAVLDVLGSKTARRILQAVTDEPRSVSEVAEVLETSIQNATYHFDNLEEAGLIEVVDTVYSPKGREMDVYASTCEVLVLFGGEATDRSPADVIEELDRQAGSSGTHAPDAG